MKDYKKGNVNFEFIVQDNSTAEEYGAYKNEIINEAIDEVSISEAYDLINKTISKTLIIFNIKDIYKITVLNFYIVGFVFFFRKQCIH